MKVEFVWRFLSSTAFAVMTCVGLGLPTLAQAQNRWLSTIWNVEPISEIPPEREYAGRDFLLKQRLIPAGLVSLSENFSDTALKLSAPAGTQFFRVESEAGVAFCDGRRNGKKANSEVYLCLVDSNEDGIFDGSFKGLSETAGIPTIAGKLPKTLKPTSPVRYVKLAPSEFSILYFVAIQRRNFFNIYGRESFMIRFGTEEHSQKITNPVHFKASDLPKEMEILGARFTAIKESNGKMRIKIHSTMPKQPFGLIRTVTFR